MNKIKMIFMLKKPTLNELAASDMSKNAKTVFLASFEDARKEQAKVLRRAKTLVK